MTNGHLYVHVFRNLGKVAVGYTLVDEKLHEWLQQHPQRTPKIPLDLPDHRSPALVQYVKLHKKTPIYMTLRKLLTKLIDTIWSQIPDSARPPAMLIL